MSTETVSVGMPVYNGADFLPDALDALLAQTYGDIELIISDNASTDATPMICAEYASRDRRIRYIRNPENIGGARNLARVLNLATHSLFMWAAHDDRWHPSYIELCVAELTRRENAVLCGTTTVFMSRTGELLYPYFDENLDTTGRDKIGRIGSVLQEMKRNCLFYGIYRRAEIDRLPIQTYYGFDHVLVAQAATLGEFIQCPEQYFYMRQGGEGSSADGYNASPGVAPSLLQYLPNLGLAYHFLEAVNTWPDLTPPERRTVRQLVLRRFMADPYPKRMLLDMALVPRRVWRMLLSRRSRPPLRPGGISK